MFRFRPCLRVVRSVTRQIVALFALVLLDFGWFQFELIGHLGLQGTATALQIILKLVFQVMASLLFLAAITQ